MYQAEYSGINAFLKGSCKLLLEEGIKRQTRGRICYELPEPYMFKITNPTARLVMIPERKWYGVLPYAESLWLASGRNDMAFIRHYLTRLDNFSDDKLYMRGGYGPRFRHFNGESLDYAVDKPTKEQNQEVDQFRYVLECFNEDEQTRRAIITIGDPMKDDFDTNHHLKKTLDVPCTRQLHFMRDASDNKLNLVVSMRSHDMLWGASAVNIFNFTFMQEYFAAMLNMEIGSYFHIVNNFHFYEDKSDMVEQIASSGIVDDNPYTYRKTFKNLYEFDALVKTLSDEETKMRLQQCDYRYYEFDDPFFRDWYNVIFAANLSKEVEFVNPQLKNLKFKIR